VDDLKTARPCVVDAGLFGGEPVLDQLVLDPLIGERARCVEAERLEVACEHLHGGDTAGFDRLDELSAGGERKICAAPQAEPLGIGEIVHCGGPRRRHVHHAGIWQRVLQAQARPALLRGRLLAAFAIGAGGVLHRVRLVENDRSVEVTPQPIDDLADAGDLFFAGVRPQRRVRGEQDAFIQTDGRPLTKS
jgi:hypothetical protein